jgi:uncharacterized membrane protein YvbJ
MAKFCGNCGAQLDDNAVVCGNCGTPVNGKKIDDKKEKKVNKKVVGIIVSLIVVVLVAVVAGTVVKRFTGSRALLSKVMSAYEKGDADKLISLASEMYDYEPSKDYTDNYFENILNTDLDSFENKVGHKYKISYSIDEIYTMSNRKQEQNLKSIEKTFEDFDTDIVKKMVVAEVDIKAKGSEGKSKTIKRKITMSKENGKWKLMTIAY